MKVIIAGSRTITDYGVVCDAINASGFRITEVVSGGCRGVDALGEQWAASNDVHTEVFPADWYGLGKSAGPLRNREMAHYADALIAVYDGKSRGTANMIHEARQRGLKVYVHTVEAGGGQK